MVRALEIDDLFGSEASWEGVRLDGLSGIQADSAFVCLEESSESEGESIRQESTQGDESTLILSAESLKTDGGDVLVHGFQVSDEGRYFLLGQFATWKRAKVNIDYHIEDGGEDEKDEKDVTEYHGRGL